MREFANKVVRKIVKALAENEKDNLLLLFIMAYSVLKRSKFYGFRDKNEKY